MFGGKPGTTITVGPEASRESRCEFYNFLVGSQVQPSPWAMRPVERTGVSFITFGGKPGTTITVGNEASRESRCEFYNFLAGSKVQPSPWGFII